MIKNIKLFHYILAIFVAIFTTGWMRVHLIPFGPEPDGGHNTFGAQWFYESLSNTGGLSSDTPLMLYQLLTSWVYGLNINQYMALRWIDLILAVIASVIFFRVIEKESASLPFTFIVVAGSLLVMNHTSVIFFGYNNSIWASYVPFFVALLFSQNIKKDSNYGFHIIGALAAFGVLLREPFLVFFIVGAISIFIAFGLRAFFKFLFGAAILGFSIMLINIMLRGWDFISIFNNYVYLGSILLEYKLMMPDNHIKSGLFMMSEFWFGLFLIISAATYMIKVYFSSPDKVNIRRFLFWLSLALVPLIEAYTKVAGPYHFAQCIPGIIGFSALGWRYFISNESVIKQKYSMVLIYLICLTGMYSNLYLIYSNFKDDRTFKNAYNQLWEYPWNEFEVIKTSNYLISAHMIKQLSNNDSTLAMAGAAGSALYPLTGLRPPVFKLSDMRSLYKSVGDEAFIDNLKKNQPTLVMPTYQAIWGIAKLTNLIQRTGLYEKVAHVEYRTDIDVGTISGDIYRLKSFIKDD